MIFENEEHEFVVRMERMCVSMSVGHGMRITTIPTKMTDNIENAS